MADDTRYAYAVARVRGMETRLLDRQWIERLLSESAEGVLRALSDSAYQGAVAEVARPEDLEEGLMRALGETLSTVSSICPEPELIDLFRVRWDFRNLKSLLKARLLKVEDGEIGTVAGIGTVELATLEKAIAEKDYTTVPGFLADGARGAEQAYADSSELSEIDRILDNAMWEHLLAVAGEHGSAFLEGFFGAQIDLANIKAFVRVKEAGGDRNDLERVLVPRGTLDVSFFMGALGEATDAFARALEYGRYASVAPVFREWSGDRTHALELACDNILLRLVEPAKTAAYGIEPLVAFILMRQIEIKLVRAAVVAKLDGIERGEIERRLRATHV